MTYEEFVRRFCEGMTPTTQQEVVIRQLLANRLAGYGSFFVCGRGAGKTTIRRWIINMLVEQENEECGWDRWSQVPDPRFES